MDDSDIIDLGQLGYMTYGRETGFRTFDGRPMPAWEDLGDTIQAAWRAAGEEIITESGLAAQKADTMNATQPAASSAQQPSIGRVVLVPMDPRNNNGSNISPAIITRVWTETMVNVRVIPDGAFPTEARTSLSYTDTVDGLHPENGGLARWTWPPRT